MDDTIAVDVESSDEAFRTWMRGNLDRAADQFGLRLLGDPLFGWCLRSISSRAHGPTGPCWLRVGSEQTRWLHGDIEFWTGNVDANAIAGVPKPVVLDHIEWDALAQGRRVRAEVMTLLPGQLCSPREVAVDHPHVSSAWWRQLRQALATLRATPTARHAGPEPRVSERVREVLDIEVTITEWETTHGDLHWAQLLADPEQGLGILDWEMWGRGPAGTDAASLYCYSLPVPTLAARVHAEFADVLDSAAGRVAQLCTVARLLPRAEHEYPELIKPLRRHVDHLLAH